MRTTIFATVLTAAAGLAGCSKTYVVEDSGSAAPAAYAQPAPAASTPQQQVVVVDKEVQPPQREAPVQQVAYPPIVPTYRR